MKQKSLAGNSAKKRWILIGCAIGGVAVIGLAVGLSVGLTQCKRNIIDAKHLNISNGILHGFNQPYNPSWGSRLVIPKTVRSIGYHAFNYCAGLTSLTIPSSVAPIGDYAFAGCSGLNVNNVTIPDAISGYTIIKSATTKIIWDDSNNMVAGSLAFGVLDEDVFGTLNITTSIGNDTFAGCSGLTSLTIPSSVNSIGEWAFDGCSELRSLDLTEFSGFYDADWAFDCILLNDVYISENTSRTSDKTNDDGWDQIGPNSGCRLHAPNETIANAFRSNIIVGSSFSEQQAAKWMYTPSN